MKMSLQYNTNLITDKSVWTCLWIKVPIYKPVYGPFHYGPYKDLSVDPSTTPSLIHVPFYESVRDLMYWSMNSCTYLCTFSSYYTKF